MTLERQARLLRAAAKRVAQICKTTSVPDFDDSRTVPALTSLGLGRATGLNYFIPRFLQPLVVQKVLFAAAMHPDAAQPERKRSFFPDYSSLPKSLWSGPGRRRLVGKQAPVEDVALPGQKRLTSSHKTSTQSVQWNEDEQRELDSARNAIRKTCACSL